MAAHVDDLAGAIILDRRNDDADVEQGQEEGGCDEIRDLPAFDHNQRPGAFRAWLRQILVNLIGNAVKFTPAGGIAVRARLVNASSGHMGGLRHHAPEEPALSHRSPDSRRAWIALQVVDTGVGIAPDNQDRIFDEFEQVNAGPRGDSMQRGTGLGLAIARDIARSHGGDIALGRSPLGGLRAVVRVPV